MKKVLLFLLVISLSINASEKLNVDGKSCSVPKNIMIAVLMNESSNKRPLGYEYIIRVNGKENSRITRKVFKSLIKDEMIEKLGRDVYDCKNEKLCITIANHLISNGVKNLDLGAYQTNYYYHPDKLEKFFNFNSSYLMACRYQHKLINQYGYSWKTVAMYHSKTKKYNSAYQERLFKNYNKIISNPEEGIIR